MNDDEYAAALDALAEYERRIAESDRLAQADSMKTAEILDRLYRDERWVEERNTERQATAKTAAGGRPVDPTSRSQFSTWLRGRYSGIAPSTTYQLLDAYKIRTEFLPRAEITPTAEYQLRPLKTLTKVAHGSGARIPEVWDIAVKLADGGQPTKDQVREAIAEWKRLHLPPAQERRERAIDRAEVKRRKAEAAWKDLLKVAGTEQINAFLAVVEQDVKQIEETGERPA